MPSPTIVLTALEAQKRQLDLFVSQSSSDFPHGTLGLRYLQHQREACMSQGYLHRTNPR